MRLLPAAFFFVFVPIVASATPVTINEGVAPPLPGKGQGLCIASATTMQPQLDFGFLNSGNFNGGVNSFMEAHAGDRIHSILNTPFDLSNNIVIAGQTISYGDFRDSLPGTCKTGGCDFVKNDSTTSFASRVRGYLNVTSDFAGKPIHIGFYADDAVSLLIFDKNGGQYPIATRPPQLGAPTWRTTNLVTFNKAGLYPIEVLFVQIVDYAALEMSYLVGNFVDFERSANQSDADSLSKSNFVLFLPDHFFLTVSGVYPYSTDPKNPNAPPDTNKCSQCDRQFVNRPGNNGCDPGYYCNDAALCAACDTALLCGDTCSPCGQATPFCTNVNGKHACVNCREDGDCKTGFHCNLNTNECCQCTKDDQCKKGEVCDGCSCQPCTPMNTKNNGCAGNSCNCCPAGSSGQPMQCADIDKNGKPVCVECTSDADCSGKRCDLSSGNCVPMILPNTTRDCCGTQCTKCTEDKPFCIPNYTGDPGARCSACRFDSDCVLKDRFCVSGNCVPCLADHRCGPRCLSCGGSTPYCLGDRDPATAQCVRCIADSQCPDGKCNQQTHDCEPGCAMSCGGATPYCLGANCVECYADTQCPCGGSCDPAGHICSTRCKNNFSCNGNQCCADHLDPSKNACEQGLCPGTSCQSPWASEIKDKTGISIGTTESALLQKTGAIICSNGSSCFSRVGGRGGDASRPLFVLGLLALAGGLARRRFR